MVEIQFLVHKTRIEKYWIAKFNVNAVPRDVFIQTAARRRVIQGKWIEKEKIVISNLERITGIHAEGDFNVFVLPVELGIGHYLDKENIEWGYAELYENYSVIALAHELLHCLTHDFYSTVSDNNKWLFHALIYLSTDEELCFVLNGKSEYFSSPIADVYHPRLIATARNILPHWKTYRTNSQGRSIIDFCKEQQPQLENQS